MRYDAWGKVLGVFDGSGNSISNQQSQIGNRYLWQGREYSWKSGLYYFRARWYDPVTGRWLSNDPIGISGGLNQYVFCSDNPVNFRDPLGLDGDEKKIIIKAAIERIRKSGHPIIAQHLDVKLRAGHIIIADTFIQKYLPSIATPSAGFVNPLFPGTIYLNPSQFPSSVDDSRMINLADTLAHELIHSLQGTVNPASNIILHLLGNLANLIAKPFIDSQSELELDPTEWIPSFVGHQIRQDYR